MGTLLYTQEDMDTAKAQAKLGGKMEGFLLAIGNPIHWPSVKELMMGTAGVVDSILPDLPGGDIKTDASIVSLILKRIAGKL